MIDGVSVLTSTRPSIADRPTNSPDAFGEPSIRVLPLLGQLDPAETMRVPADAYSRYVDRLQNAGQRMGDIKPVSLSPLDGWSAVFSDVVVPDRFARMLPAKPQPQQVN